MFSCGGGVGDFGFGRSRAVGVWEQERRWRRLESGLKLNLKRGFEGRGWGLGAVPVLDLGLRPLVAIEVWRGRLHRDRIRRRTHKQDHHKQDHIRFWH
jgi:hypothetical protein